MPRRTLRQRAGASLFREPQPIPRAARPRHAAVAARRRSAGGGGLPPRCLTTIRPLFDPCLRSSHSGPPALDSGLPLRTGPSPGQQGGDGGDVRRGHGEPLQLLQRHPPAGARPCSAGSPPCSTAGVGDGRAVHAVQGGRAGTVWGRETRARWAGPVQDEQCSVGGRCAGGGAGHGGRGVQGRETRTRLAGPVQSIMDVCTVQDHGEGGRPPPLRTTQDRGAGPRRSRSWTVSTACRRVRAVDCRQGAGRSVRVLVEGGGRLTASRWG